MSLYDDLTDKGIILKVADLFYDKVYEDPWLSLYFKEIDQEFITAQQVDFIVGAMGGPQKYSGRLPSNAHPHMFITEELFELRTKLLEDALKELSAPESLVEFWLKLDGSFKNSIVKKSPSELTPRYATDEFLNFDNPNPRKKAC